MVVASSLAGIASNQCDRNVHLSWLCGFACWLFVFWTDFPLGLSRSSTSSIIHDELNGKLFGHTSDAFLFVLFTCHTLCWEIFLLAQYLPTLPCICDWTANIKEITLDSTDCDWKFKKKNETQHTLWARWLWHQCSLVQERELPFPSV